MRKGDEKRQELLDTAERLFCRQGYDATGLSELLNALGLSKGGFYHHFPSKDAVLTALCERHIQRAAEGLDATLAAIESPMGRINATLHAFMPLRREMEPFLQMLLPYLHLPASRCVAMAYQEALLEEFLPMMETVVADACAAQAIFPEMRGLERTVLHLTNLCWLEMARMLPAGPAALLPVLSQYRRAVELLLGAPFGSMEVIRLEEVTALQVKNQAEGS